MQVLIEASELGPGAKDSVVEGGHIRSIDRDARIDSKTGVWCHLSDDVMERIDNALRSSLAL
jgi:mRNA-degrading endonuclease toxin of MazEF toxin-antitoxin module